MPSAFRDRFLIALAKFFGESSERDLPQASIQLSPAELMDEILASILVSEKVELTLEKFNRLMISYRHRLATQHFFDYFFGATKTIDDFEKAVDRYRIKAMWLFGNFRFAYRSLATSERNNFDKLIADTEPLAESQFSSRDKFQEIEPIPAANLHLLGYIAKAAWEGLELAHATVRQLGTPGVDGGAVIRGIGAEKLAEVFRKNHIEVPNKGLDQLSDGERQKIDAQIMALLEPLRTARNEAVKIGLRNTDRYLTLSHLDVYVATSMREDQDFRAQSEFTKKVFADPQIEPLKLRYFDPTLSYVEDRITKGLIEMLMLKRANVTIYVAGATDTLGKDSELAATLAQGKAVIAYVPTGEVALPCGTPDCKRKVSYDQRAENFREDHPLGLQIAVETGVAHGIMVVRSPEQCAAVLRRVMLRERTFTIEHEQNVFRLRETESKSVVRVVSDNALLTHAFWTYFNME